MGNDNATRKQEQLEHLAHVNALRQAIASAISAIEKNDLTQLETHLATQETICNRLSATKRRPLLTASGIAAVTDDADGASLLQEIRHAHLALAQLNRVYASLLKRVRRSLGLMAAIYRSHGEGYDRSPSPLLQGHTWSCEV